MVDSFKFEVICVVIGIEVVVFVLLLLLVGNICLGDGEICSMEMCVNLMMLGDFEC